MSAEGVSVTSPLLAAAGAINPLAHKKFLTSADVSMIEAQITKILTDLQNPSAYITLITLDRREYQLLDGAVYYFAKSKGYESAADKTRLFEKVHQVVMVSLKLRAYWVFYGIFFGSSGHLPREELSYYISEVKRINELEKNPDITIEKGRDPTGIFTAGISEVYKYYSDHGDAVKSSALNQMVMIAIDGYYPKGGCGCCCVS
jgi:hypothetical protein